MGIRKYNPTTPGLRGMTAVSYTHLDIKTAVENASHQIIIKKSYQSPINSAYNHQ